MDIKREGGQGEFNEEQMVWRPGSVSTEASAAACQGIKLHPRDFLHLAQPFSREPVPVLAAVVKQVEKCELFVPEGKLPGLERREVRRRQDDLPALLVRVHVTVSDFCQRLARCLPAVRDRKSTRLNSSHSRASRMPSSA